MDIVGESGEKSRDLQNGINMQFQVVGVIKSAPSQACLAELIGVTVTWEMREVPTFI